MENLPVEIYTWTILAVIDSSETPFLEATYFPTGASRMGVLTERETHSYVQNYFRSKGVFRIRPLDDPFTNKGKCRWDDVYSQALTILNEYDCLDVERASDHELEHGANLSVTSLGRALLTRYDIHIDSANDHIYLFERCFSESINTCMSARRTSCPIPLRSFEITKALTG